MASPPLSKETRLLFFFFLLFTSSSLSAQETQHKNDSLSFSFPLTSLPRSLQTSPSFYSSFISQTKKAPTVKGSSSSSSPYNYRSGFKYSMILLVSLPIGTPPQTQQMILDTGSQLSWTQCHKKVPRKPPPSTAFDPSLSSSFSVLPCNHPLCKPRIPDFTLPTTCDQNRLCHYSYFYADGTLAEGNLVREKIAFSSSQSTPPFILGCAEDGSDEKGILGMNLGRLSFASQAKITKFSYCVPARQVRPGFAPTGSFYLGTNPNSGGFQYISLLTFPKSQRLPNLDPLAYTVAMQGIRIGNKKLNIPVSAFRADPSGAGQTMIDSGSEFTYLVDEAYNKVREEVVRLVGPKLKKGYVYSGITDMCFDGNAMEIGRLIGNMVFEFDKGVEIVIEKESSATPTINQPIPMDLIFFFHKALMKDLEDLVFGSVKLAENIGFLTEFQRHFHLLQFRYQFHSEAEDKIAFPALEAKEEVRNISHSYTIDHKLEVECFNEVSHLLDKMSELHISASTNDSEMQDQIMVKHNRLCMKLHYTCKSMHKLLSDHVHREEVELWPLFRECFSIQEQEKIIGRMLGSITAETLQDMIPWLLGSLTPEEQRVMMSSWRNVAKNTMFDEWLREWWEGYDIAQVTKKLNTSCTADPLDIIARYIPTENLDKQGDGLYDAIEFSERVVCSVNTEKQEEESFNDKVKAVNGDRNNDEYSKYKKLNEGDKERFNEASDLTNKTDKPGESFQLTLKSRYHKQLLIMSQDDMEAAIRKVSRDSSLDPQKKSYIIQNLIMSRWIVHQKISHSEVTISTNGEEIPGQHPSYRDFPEQMLGCKHYKRNCKLVMPCCNKLYTCIRCHDELADHSTDRRAITKMMCMKCLIIQPIRETCSTVSCNNLSMGRYYCRICKLFDDEREIYHCPYCNLCRVGKGLGIDYFHCMNCNACMGRSLSVHVCREKCLEENCPICHEYIFTSSTPVKALPCGHLMHSTCFQDYTCTHYTCPVCSKSLGDMQVYFQMLDALLAEEKIPDEYSGQTQVILCNDCEKKGAARFHWLYRKCPFCGSYNTRLL